MKFFHFTPVSNVERITAKGLEPRLSRETIARVGRRGVVWLTTEPTTKIDKRELTALRKRDPDKIYVSQRWMRADTDEPLARFTVQLIGNPKLTRYGDWLRKLRDPGLPALDSLTDREAAWWMLIEDFIRPSMLIGKPVIEAAPLVQPKARAP